MEIGDEVRSARGAFTSTGRHHNSAYSPESLGDLGGAFVEAVIMGELLGRTNITSLAQHFSVRPAKVRALLEQIDGPRELNFLSRGIVCGQVREIAREISAGGGGRLVFVRTQPTSPTTGIRLAYGPNTAFGLDPGRRRKIGTFDSIYATWSSPFDDGHEQSVDLAGLIPALDKDREERQRGVLRDHLSPLQQVSLSRPTAAMFRHAGAVDLAMRDELPPEVEANLYIFLQGRYEGYEESVFLSSPTHRVPIVGEPYYQQEARKALGDDVDIVVEAEGMSPFDRGLDPRHVYVDLQGRVLQNEEVRRIVDHDLTVRLGRGLKAEHRDVTLTLMPGELHASLPGGGHEGGQALLQRTAAGPPVWFSLLNKASGRRAWHGSEDELRRRLQHLAEAFALLEAPDSTAGKTRREQYHGLEEFDVPMSHPSGRQIIWGLVAALRLAGLPDAPLKASLL